MTPASKSFLDAITEIKHASAQLLIDTVEDDPLATAGLVTQVANGVFGELTTNDKLRLVSEVNGVGAFGVPSSYARLEDMESISDFIDVAFDACVDHYLRDTKATLAAVTFAVGFLPAAREAVEVAELSGDTNWMPADKVRRVRTALNVLAASEGTLSDLATALEAVTLFDKLLQHPKDKVLHQRHHTDIETIGRVKESLKFYVDLLGPNRRVAPEALSILSGRQRNLPIIEAERERTLARRNRTP